MLFAITVLLSPQASLVSESEDDLAFRGCSVAGAGVSTGFASCLVLLA
jgi:hypothetical protein